MSRVSLDGQWEFARAGEGEAAPNEPGGWTATRVPSNWHLSGHEDYAGRGWYRRSFEKPENATGGRIWLRFEGVDYFATVYLNGEAVARHEGYFQAFEAEVTDRLREGENELLVCVDSPKERIEDWPNNKYLIKGVLNHHDCRPGSWDPAHGQDGNTGGIWNSVALVTDPGVRAHAVRVAPSLLEGGVARLRVTAEVSAAVTGAASATLVIRDPRGAEVRREVRDVFPEGGPQAIHWVVTVLEPELWWTWDHGAQPLYTATVTVETDDRRDESSATFGIRELRIDKDWVWWLNGKRIFTRGTNVIPTQWLSEYNAAMIARDMSQLRSANINAVRVHAHVQREEFYAALDRAGILCWQDFALQWSYEETDSFAANACRQIRDMALGLYNYPSIVVWCCHNEPAKNRETLDPLLEAAIREVDSSRHIEAASDFQFHTYPGWYFGHWRNYSEAPAAPFINEFGAQALMNVDSMRETFGEAAWPPDWARWTRHDFQYGPTFDIAGVQMADTLEGLVANSQAYQANLLKFAIEQYRLNRFQGARRVTGLFQFMFMDCWPAITWSVVDYYRRPKAGYEALRIAYQPLLPVVRLGFGGEVLPAGGRLLFDVPCVNDRHEAYEDLQVDVNVTAPDGTVVQHIERRANIGPDTLSRIVRTCEWRISPDAEAGTYRINVAVRDAGGRMLATNWGEFSVARLPEGTYQPAVVE